MTDQTVSAETPAETTVDLTTKIEAPETVETPPPAEAKTETTEPEATETDETGEPQRKNIPGSQRLKRRLELIQQDFAAATRRIQELETQQLPAPPHAQTGQPGVDREPREQDFPNDWLAFQSAQTAWNIRQAVKQTVGEVFNQNQQGTRQVREAEAHRERMIAYEENAHEARERIPDFDKVVGTASNIQVKPEVAEELLASDKSALLQYHLAKNPDKVRELNGMSGKELAREIGRLESRVHLPTAKKATEATPPPKEIKGAAAQAVDPQFGPDDMNAYAAWRAKQRAS